MRLSRLLLAVGSLGCHSALPGPPPPAPAPPHDDGALLAAMQEARHRMHARFASADDLVDALVRGDMDGVRAAAGTLSQIDDPEAIPRWQPYVASVQASARAVEQADDLRAASAGAATLATRCASCHLATKARIQLADPAPPADPSPLAQQMRDHHRAARRLWQGLIAPSEQRWDAGANALIGMPFNIVAQGGPPGLASDIDDTTRVRLYGRRALAASSDHDRADVFADLLMTCAHCHAVLRDH